MVFMAQWDHSLEVFCCFLGVKLITSPATKSYLSAVNSLQEISALRQTIIMGDFLVIYKAKVNPTV